MATKISDLYHHNLLTNIITKTRSNLQSDKVTIGNTLNTVVLAILKIQINPPNECGKFS